MSVLKTEYVESRFFFSFFSPTVAKSTSIFVFSTLQGTQASPIFSAHTVHSEPSTFSQLNLHATLSDTHIHNWSTDTALQLRTVSHVQTRTALCKVLRLFWGGTRAHQFTRVVVVFFSGHKCSSVTQPAPQQDHSAEQSRNSASQRSHIHPSCLVSAFLLFLSPPFFLLHC